MRQSIAVPADQVFSLEEVNALLPELSRVVGEQLDMRQRIESLLDTLAEATSVRGDVTPRPTDSAEVQRQKRDIARRIDEYHRGWARVETMGGVLKDPREGLVDFYGRVAGRLVWLCWKFGEQQCNHYHQLDEGFSARKCIEESGRRILLN
jgi:hypothetical protein